MKTMNIFGCCCSRFLFNFSPLKDEFQVKKYAFQNSVWSCFDSSLELPVSDIEKIDTAPFTRRMIHYELNKAVITEFEANPADFFLIDLLTISFPVYKVEFMGHTTYTQNISIGSTVLPQMVQMPEFAGLTCQKMGITEISETNLRERLDLFSDWVRKQYPVERIILTCPKRAEHFLLPDVPGVNDYTDSEIERFRKLDAITKKYTDDLKASLGNVLYYEYHEDLLAFDKNVHGRQPAAYHYPDEVYIGQGKDILSLLAGK